MTSTQQDIINNHTSDNADDRYLVFRVGNDAIAAPLLSIREIVEPLAYRPVPNEREYLLGLANLRGQVIGVLDLGLRFGLGAAIENKDCVFLVFDVEGGVMAGVAHSIDTVTVIEPQAISHDCQLDMKIPAEAMRGIARKGGRLLPIVHLADLVRVETSVA
jgi:purine-binding chemotaxis protein CheW